MIVYLFSYFWMFDSLIFSNKHYFTSLTIFIVKNHISNYEYYHDTKYITSSIVSQASPYTTNH